MKVLSCVIYKDMQNPVLKTCVAPNESINVLVLRGNDFFMSMNYNKLSPQVAWIKSDTKAILAIHNHVISNNGKVSVTHNVGMDTWTLKIKDVKQVDSGTYQCQVNAASVVQEVRKLCIN